MRQLCLPSVTNKITDKGIKQHATHWLKPAPWN